MIRTNVFIIGSVVLTLAACSSQRNKVSQNAKTKGLPAWAQDKKEDPAPTFYNAMREKMAGNYSSAISLFAQVLKMEPDNDAALFNLAQIYIQQNKPESALPLITKAYQLAPDNVWYGKVKAELLARANKLAEAADIYQKLIKQNPSEQETYYSLIATYVYANKVNDALKVYDKMEERFGVQAETSIQKEKLYIKLGKIDAAAKELDKLIAAYPNEPQYYGMLAELYQANSMMDKALQTYKKLEALDPENPYLQLSLADYYRTSGQKEKSFEALKKAFGNKTVDLETKFKILASYYTLLKTAPELGEQAMVLNKIMVATHPEVAAAHAFYGEFLVRDNKLVEAKEEFEAAKKLDSKTYSIWTSLLILYLNTRDFDKLSVEADSAITLFPNQPTLYYLSGFAKIQLKQYDRGIEVLSEGAKQFVEDKALLADIYANIGEGYFRQKKNKESDGAFKKSLEIQPKNPSTLNNYSYYLSLRGDSLDIAEEMSKLSNELDPNNSYYQDTYGWILYKKSKYDEAKEWLGKAMKSRDGESGVIYEHYGDVLYKLGEKENAYEYWLKAKKIGGGSDLLDKKISEKKLFE